MKYFSYFKIKEYIKIISFYASRQRSLQAALLYYGQVSEANQKGILTAKPIYEDLNQRYIRKNKRGGTSKTA
jgi:hypothetical protein